MELFFIFQIESKCYNWNNQILPHDIHNISRRGGQLVPSWKTVRKYLWLAALILTVLIFVFSTHNVITALCMICIGTIIYVYYYYEKKSIQEHYNEQLHQKEQDQLNMLSVQRHDAMNDVQVLLGYLRLDKKDKCIEYVEKIKKRAHSQSVIAKLNDYQLVNYINNLKTCNFTVEFDIEILSDNLKWKNEYSLFMIDVISCYEIYAVNSVHDEQILSVYIAVNDEIYIQFEYTGELMDNSSWKADIESKTAKLVHDKRLILTIDEQDINSTFLA